MAAPTTTKISDRGEPSQQPAVAQVQQVAPASGLLALQRVAGNRAASQAALGMPGVPPSVQTALRGGGQPLDPVTRAFMEARFGADFGAVRVHTGASADASAAALDAAAYTVGSDLVFAEGEYQADTTVGRRLLAHELAHVVQQTSGRTASLRGLGGDEQTRQSLEHDAEQSVGRAQTLAPLPVVHSAGGGEAGAPAIQRNGRNRRHTNATVELSARVDEQDPTIIIFNRAVAVDEAIRYLWGAPPQQPNAIRPDPNESATSGRNTRFIVDVHNHMDLAFGMQHGLDMVYLRRMQQNVIGSVGRPEVPTWVPANIRELILQGQLPSGVHRYPGNWRGGFAADVVVWVSRGGRFYHVQIYQDFPSDMAFYLNVADGDRRTARLLHSVYTQFNGDMRYFVETRGMSPEMARSEIRRINAEVFRLVVEAAVGILSAGAGISAIRSTAGEVAAMAEQSGIGSRRIPGGAGPRRVRSSATREAETIAESGAPGERGAEVIPIERARARRAGQPPQATEQALPAEAEETLAATGTHGPVTARPGSAGPTATGRGEPAVASAGGPRRPGGPSTPTTPQHAPPASTTRPGGSGGRPSGPRSGGSTREDIHEVMAEEIAGTNPEALVRARAETGAMHELSTQQFIQQYRSRLNSIERHHSFFTYLLTAISKARGVRGRTHQGRLVPLPQPVHYALHQMFDRLFPSLRRGRGASNRIAEMIQQGQTTAEEVADLLVQFYSNLAHESPQLVPPTMLAQIERIIARIRRRGGI